MRIAIPMTGGLLAQHFGHCEQFELVDIDPATRTVSARTSLPAPVHEHGVLPRFLRENGANLVIAGGIGQGAQTLLRQAGIEVLAGVESRLPDDVVAGYLNGTLTTGVTSCGHGAEHGHNCH